MVMAVVVTVFVTYDVTLLAEPSASPYLHRIKDLDAPKDPTRERPPCIDMRVQVGPLWRHGRACGSEAATAAAHSSQWQPQPHPTGTHQQNSLIIWQLLW